MVYVVGIYAPANINGLHMCTAELLLAMKNAELGAARTTLLALLRYVRGMA